ncbi:hypothetical protein PRECH8_20630 [Insulibacter thermoxylanivorax]|uniref:YqzE-like protein n=1 Tax=Insulibacter thermoxylanivorax TaxID=2749268 RepID=A0A916VFX4_9BACL|nr:YqzE family protein [Insulibacter thermoxylanivorax]GFR38767.1 hypothetical protein PRECH8_20630 [Insulibacter thermoxylanivorax]
MSIVRDLAKIAAEKLIYTLETPREVRREERRQRRSQSEPWQTRYFGMLPMSFQVWRANRRRTDHLQETDYQEGDRNQAEELHQVQNQQNNPQPQP